MATFKLYKVNGPSTTAHNITISTGVVIEATIIPDYENDLIDIMYSAWNSQTDFENNELDFKLKASGETVTQIMGHTMTAQNKADLQSSDYTDGVSDIIKDVFGFANVQVVTVTK